MKAQIALRSRPDQLLPGTVLRVEPLADAVTEEILAKIGFETPDSLPPIGELAEVTIALPARAKSLAVPNAAVHRVDGSNGVWVVRDGDLLFAVVKLGAQDNDGWVQILSGLKKGEKIVIHSAKALSDSSRISIVDKLP